MQRSRNFRRLGYKSRILVSLTRVFTMKHCQFNGLYAAEKARRKGVNEDGRYRKYTVAYAQTSV